MWYLVIPPIIVILSLAFLLWYLSRKGADPVIVEKMSLSGEEKLSFLRTKEFFLRILEKWAQHFKVISLRTHNSLHEFSQSVKERRRKIHGNIPSEMKLTSGEISESSVTDQRESGFFSRLKEKMINEVRPHTGEEVHEQTLSDQSVEKNEIPPRPMVSETVAEPEVRKRMKPNGSREETLIARIAVNPKDFTAYEELGDYYLETENVKDAKECYRQVLKLSPVHRMVKIKIRRLEKLLTREGE